MSNEELKSLLGPKAKINHNGIQMVKNWTPRQARDQMDDAIGWSRIKTPKVRKLIKHIAAQA